MAVSSSQEDETRALFLCTLSELVRGIDVLLDIVSISGTSGRGDARDYCCQACTYMKPQKGWAVMNVVSNDDPGGGPDGERYLAYRQPRYS